MTCRVCSTGARAFVPGAVWKEDDTGKGGKGKGKDMPVDPRGDVLAR